MKVYLAARFSRLPELVGYADELGEHGIEVTFSPDWEAVKVQLIALTAQRRAA